MFMYHTVYIKWEYTYLEAIINEVVYCLDLYESWLYRLGDIGRKYKNLK